MPVECWHCLPLARATAAVGGTRASWRRLFPSLRRAHSGTSGVDVEGLKSRSQELTGEPSTGDWHKRAGARAFLRAVGWGDSDFRKPIITVACPWTNASPCNNHFRELGDLICDLVELEGGKPFIHGTPVVTDGEAQGMEAMRYSLMSRDLIADCIETMHEAYRADAIITLSGCDKTQPGTLMPIVRNNSVGITLYGGTMVPVSYTHLTLPTKA